jgi:hypothetical protein
VDLWDMLENGWRGEGERTSFAFEAASNVEPEGGWGVDVAMLLDN